jgi:hypothetical protein
MGKMGIMNENYTRELIFSGSSHYTDLIQLLNAFVNTSKSLDEILAFMSENEDEKP